MLVTCLKIKNPKKRSVSFLQKSRMLGWFHGGPNLFKGVNMSQCLKRRFLSNAWSPQCWSKCSRHDLRAMNPACRRHLHQWHSFRKSLRSKSPFTQLHARKLTAGTSFEKRKIIFQTKPPVFQTKPPVFVFYVIFQGANSLAWSQKETNHINWRPNPLRVPECFYYHRYNHWKFLNFPLFLIYPPGNS